MGGKAVFFDHIKKGRLPKLTDGFRQQSTFDKTRDRQQRKKGSNNSNAHELAHVDIKFSQYVLQCMLV